jgi:hypothetical protein
MKRHLVATSAAFALVLSLVTGPASGAKPADLPAEKPGSQAQLGNQACAECGEKTPHGSITLGWDLFTGGITVRVQVTPAKVEPPVNIDALCPSLVPVYLEQLLKYVGAALTNGQRMEAEAARAQKARAMLETRLFEPVNVKIKNVPLRQAIKNLACASGVRMAPDYADLKAGRVDLDAPVSLAVENTSLHTALQQLLDPLRLTYAIEDGMLKITRMEKQMGCPSGAALAARAKNHEAQRIFEIGERCRRNGEYGKARTCYQQVHLLTPTTLHGRVAIVRLIEIEERMRESSEEQGGPGRVDDPKQVYRDMRDRSIPLGLVEVSY